MASPDLTKIVVTDLLPRERLLELWEEYKASRPEEFARMLRYDGSDLNMVEAMRIRVIVFVLGKLERGELPVRPGKDRTITASAIGGSMVQLAKVLHPNIVFKRTDPF
jgi:hypothetical protein